MAAGDFAFGSLVLSDNTNYVVEVAAPPAAPVDLMRMGLARREGSAVASVRHAEHVASVKGLVKSTTFQDTEDKLDALMKALYNGEQTLKLGYQDERGWRVRLLGEPSIEKRSGLLYLYEIQFLAADPYAYAASASQSAPGAVAFSRA